MLGALVEVVSGANGQWLVRYGGELWQAHSAAPLLAGQSARIVRVSGLTLWVEAPSPSASSPP
jgi:membrane protein implicated in regulation of membrane protease activity